MAWCLPISFGISFSLLLTFLPLSPGRINLNSNFKVEWGRGDKRKRGQQSAQHAKVHPKAIFTAAF